MMKKYHLIFNGNITGETGTKRDVEDTARHTLFRWVTLNQLLKELNVRWQKEKKDMVS